MDWQFFRERVRALDPRPRLLAQATAPTPLLQSDQASLDTDFLRAFAKLQVVSRTGQVEELPQLADTFLSLYARAAAGRQRINAADALARCHYEIAGARLKARDLGETQAAFATAAQWFEQAGDLIAAERCRNKALSAAADLSYEVDALRSEQLRKAGESSDPIKRIDSLDALLDSTIQTGDRFEASTLAEQLARALRIAQLLDPQEVGLDHAVDSWIANVPAANRTEYLANVFLALRAYSHLLSVRMNEVSGKPELHLPLEKIFSELALSGISDEAARQDRLVDAEISAEWNRVFPNAAQESPAQTETIAEAEEQFSALNKRRNAFENEFNEIYNENEARDYGVDRQDLIGRVTQLEAYAANLEYDFYRAKALQLHGEILNYDRQLEKAVEALDQARATLLQLSPSHDFQAFSNAERGLYEVILRRKLDVLGQLGDNARVSDVSEEGIRLVESRRYQLNNPERQSAFMGWRSTFYTYGIAAARQLGDWDKYLERMELVKARTLLRTRLSPDFPGMDDAALQEQFTQISVRLQTASTDAADLRAQRRQLWDLMAMGRSRRRLRAEPPIVNVENLQRALGEDEIAISYFSMATGVFHAVVVDRGGFHVERIGLTDSQMDDLNEFVTAVQSLAGYTDGIEPALRSLGAVLLPEPIRGRMQGKQRLVISPHAALHLIPFQAFPWEGSYLGLHFALRYAPSLSALLLPLAPCPGTAVFTLGISRFSVPPFNRNPLELAEEEASHVAAVHSEQHVPVLSLTGAAASRSAFEQLRARAELPKYRCLHLATHGTSVYATETRDHPLESQIILQDGWIDGLEISELQLNADLVVLSACNSGQRAIAGRGFAELPADDVFGLQSALLSSGAGCVLGALWPLSDSPGYEVMLRFHRRHAEGHAPDRALQLALIEYTAEFPQKDAFYWAPWFLITLGNGSGTTRNG